VLTYQLKTGFETSAYVVHDLRDVWLFRIVVPDAELDPPDNNNNNIGIVGKWSRLREASWLLLTQPCYHGSLLLPFESTLR
jgi:hypothetical protein